LSELLDPLKVVSRNKSLGGTSPQEVRRMAKDLRKKAGAKAADLLKKKAQIEAAKELTASEMKDLI